ncbi:MAG: ImmA/IrrE family metallo-endopeptidase [Candidatus Brocadia sp.]|nr:ImmA/IrrE family metallo-endopeptidase [Candidatus Brocadia sp.]
MIRVTNLNKEILKQAAERVGGNITDRFPKLADWLSGGYDPSVKQLAEFAKAVHIPFGYFFLDKLPELKTGVPLFRTKEALPSENYSDELRDSIRIIQNRQEWLKEYLLNEGAIPLPFVNSFNETDNPFLVAQDIRKTLQLLDDWAGSMPKWEKALNYLFDKIEDAGIYLAINGVVENNTHRPLNPDEFRGFVLTDNYAPYIFINGKDFTAAKMFTLAHELAHIWLGKSAAFDLQLMRPSEDTTEKLCNQIAAEFLVPQHLLQKRWEQIKDSAEPIEEVARQFKVSQIVAARRLLDTKRLTQKQFFEFYNDYKAKWQLFQKKQKEKEQKQRGDFYNTQHYRVGKLFFRQVYTAAKDGKLLYTDAYKLTGLYGKTFSRFENEFLTKI